jgi:hypothetical protein
MVTRQEATEKIEDARRLGASGDYVKAYEVLCQVAAYMHLAGPRVDSCRSLMDKDLPELAYGCLMGCVLSFRSLRW